jgi:hypothetical protein
VPCITRADAYVRRQPERSVLYQTVAKHWPALREMLEQAGGLPRFVVREFDEYLRCGILEEGCLHLVCRRCGFAQVVALSCKKRGFCPACLGRRMADAAVHLGSPSATLVSSLQDLIHPLPAEPQQLTGIPRAQSLLGQCADRL